MTADAHAIIRGVGQSVKEHITTETNRALIAQHGRMMKATIIASIMWVLSMTALLILFIGIDLIRSGVQEGVLDKNDVMIIVNDIVKPALFAISGFIAALLGVVLFGAKALDIYIRKHVTQVDGLIGNGNNKTSTT